MTIGLDITPLLFEGTGVAKYTYNLLKNLLFIDKKNQYKLFFVSPKSSKNFPFLKEFEDLGAKIYHIKIPFKLLSIFWQNLNIFKVERFIGKVDIFYANDYLRSPSKIKTITTIHDLTWKLYPQYHTKEVIKAHRIKIEKTIQYGDEIIVDSENTKNDLLRLYPQIDNKKVHVVYPSVDDKFKNFKIKKDIKEILKKYLKNFTHYTPALNRIYSGSGFHVPRYILYVGAIEPRKNLDIAIKVFHKLINNQQFNNLTLNNLKFLIIGRAGWKNENIFSLVKDLHLEDKVIFLGYVEDDDLPVFYQNALATVYLSEYEGFGIPPIESAYCQTPVLLYKNSSLSELFNDEYPYTKKGKEVETLQYLIKNKINSKKYLRQDFSYKKTAMEFLKIVQSL
ncbi:MAG: glycosyltransferase family 1 protein [Candidatus Microgenomates bacterium]